MKERCACALLVSAFPLCGVIGEKEEKMWVDVMVIIRGGGWVGVGLEQNKGERKKSLIPIFVNLFRDVCQFCHRLFFRRKSKFKF